MSVALVTGADRGIGAALCQALAERGDRVFAACLGTEIPEQHRNIPGIEVLTEVDVTSEQSVSRLAAAVKNDPVDILVNCAGVQHNARLGAFDFAKLRNEYEVNALGPLRVTEALLPNLGAGSKVAIVTSRVGSLAENHSGGLYGYRMSKAAANMLGICLAHELKPDGIAVICLHPGTVRTEMTRALADSRTTGQFVEPAVAAAGLIDRLDELTLDTSGRFLHANGEVLPW